MPRWPEPDPDPLYRCNGSPSHAYRMSEAIDGGCPKCYVAAQHLRDATAGQNDGGFENRVRQDI
jgi:hypothetical protein